LRSQGWESSWPAAMRIKHLVKCANPLQPSGLKESSQ
jgi:hypothetical protein